ncbi:MAG TPA: hypothetical protein VEK08_02250 [Planctomycetota bacterium]|nr:hypothetical protein [Planctomycetota bacterium]
MGYDVHITRAENWFDSEENAISHQEWKQYVNRDKELRPEGCIEFETDEGLVEADVLAWGTEEDLALHWYSGRITAKNPSPAGIAKMFQIAQHFNARVQGDEGEFYGASGEPE